MDIGSNTEVPGAATVAICLAGGSTALSLMGDGGLLCRAETQG